MNLSHDQMIDMYTVMLRIRLFEEKLNALIAEAKIGGFIHLCIGQEAVAVGVCAALRDSDFITSTHRGHGHMIAKGGRTDLMMAELFAKKTGYCKGKGGSMHIADLDLGILGANGIVGGGPPLATGAALTAQYKGTDQVSICFFGDGASNQGTAHEAMNLASVWKLPVVFVAENNQFAEFTAQSEHQAIRSISERAAGYDMPSACVDGNDVIAVLEATTEAVLQARDGKGPTLIECMTFRLAGHFVGDTETYRDAGEVESWTSKEKDPIPRFERVLQKNSICNADQFSDIRTALEQELDEAVRFAEESPEPEIEELLSDVYHG